MNEQLAFMLAAIVMYGVLYWLQGGNKPTIPKDGIMKNLGKLTNMGHDELFMSAMCYMAFSALLAMLPIPEAWGGIIVRLTVFLGVGLAMQEFLSVKGSIETTEWIMGALLPQTIAVMVINGIPVVTQVYMVAGQIFFGLQGGMR